MTLSSRTWNRLSRQGATVKTIEQRSRRMFGLATVGVALVAAGIGTPTATLADDATFDPPTQNERSIALIEGKDPANSPADTTGDAAFQPPTANERSIARIESKEASVETAFVPLTPNQRSIMLIESRLAPGGVLADGRPPEWAPTANERSIALIESKEAPGGVLAGGIPNTERFGDW